MEIQLQNKASLLALGAGYDLRQNNSKEFTIIIHSTNGARGSAFDNEVRYLLNSKEVSAHYLISKTGNIVQFFDDITKYRAWHTGAVRDQRYNNNNSIGIECHFTPGESTFQPDMIETLTNLVLFLSQTYKIIDIETHRSVAMPKGRKIDPSFMSDAEFYAWKDKIATLQVDKIPIIGHKNTSIDILRNKLHLRGVLSYQIDPIVCAYTTYGELTGIGNVYPIAQWAHETGWGTSERWRVSNNAAGLGATNDGAWGNTFKSVAEGVLAQYAHLLCYATKPEENRPIIEMIAQLSPRREAMEKVFGRGSAKYWHELSGKWNFPSLKYHLKIMEIAKYLQ